MAWYLGLAKTMIYIMKYSLANGEQLCQLETEALYFKDVLCLCHQGINLFLFQI
jgi:hypothetical protein